MSRRAGEKQRPASLYSRRLLISVVGGLAIGLAVAAGLSAKHLFASRAATDAQAKGGAAPAVQEAAAPPEEKRGASTRPAQSAEVQAALRSAERHLVAREYTQARAGFQRARELAPGDPWPVYGLGKLDLAMNQLASGERHFREALALDAHFSPALAGWGVILGGTGHPKEGIALLERAQAEDPRNLSIRMVLGENLLRDGQAQRAIEVLEGGLELQGGRAPAQLFVLLGQAQTEAGHYEPARQALEKALRMEPHLAMPHFWLSRVWMQTGHTPEGQAESTAYQRCCQLETRIGELNAAVATRPGDVEPLLALVQANLDRGYVDQAAKLMNRAAGLAPQDEGVHVLAGKVQAAVWQASSRPGGG